MTGGALLALSSHLARLRDSFAREFPMEGEAVRGLPAFCEAVASGSDAAARAAACGSLAPFLLHLADALSGTDALEGLGAGALLLECAVYERLLAGAELSPAGGRRAVSRARGAGGSAGTLDADFVGRVESGAAYVRALRSLGLETADQRSLGWGAGDGGRGRLTPGDSAAIEACAARFRGDPVLLALAARMGRHSDGGRSRLPAKNRRPAVSRDGVWFSGDLRNVLPSELALRADPRSRPEFLRRAADGQLLCWRPAPDRSAARGKSRDMGPAVVCLDTSGSMHGVAEAVSKAAALAVISACAASRRRVLVVSFSVDFRTLEVERADSEESLAGVAAFVGSSFRGGTDIGGALEAALAALGSAPLRDADILLVSDFVAPAVDPRVTAALRRARAEGTRLRALAVGGADGGGIGGCPVLALCDEVVRYRPPSGEFAVQSA